MRTPLGRISPRRERGPNPAALFGLGLLLTGFASASFLLQGSAPSPAADPTLDLIGDQFIDELANHSFMATANDPDMGDFLVFSLDPTSLGKGMTIHPVTGVFSWTPTETQDGVHSVTITVTDSTFGTDSETIAIHVAEVNQPPYVGFLPDFPVYEPNTQGLLPQVVNLFVPGLDGDLVGGTPNTLTYSLDPASILKGMSINAATGEFFWAPTELQDGVHSVTVTVHDNQVPDLTAQDTFEINVAEVNEPPVITVVADGFTPTVYHGQGMWRDLSFFDPDVVAGVPNTLTVTLSPNPDAHFDPATGRWSIAPQAPNVGPFFSTLTVTDNGVPPAFDDIGFAYGAFAPAGTEYAMGGHSGEIRQVDADGGGVMTASADGTGKTWGGFGSFYLQKTLVGHNGPLTGIVNRGGTVVTSSEDGYLIEWDRTTGAILSVNPAHLGPVRTMSKVIGVDAWVTGGDDWNVKVWTGFPGPALNLMGHTNAITDVAGWGANTVSGSKDKTVRVWFGHMLTWPPITDHTGEITAVDIFRDGGPDMWVATASKDRKTNLYKNGVLQYSLDLGEVVTELRFELALDGRIFVGTETGRLVVLDRTGAILFTYNDASGAIRSIKHDGPFVYVTGADRKIRWYYLLPGPGLTLIREVSAHGDWVTNASSLFGAFSPYLTASWDGKAVLWEPIGTSRIATLDHGSPLVAGFASPFATVGRDGTIKFWAFDFPNWSVVASGTNPEAPWSASTLLGTLLLVGAQNGNVRIWDGSATNTFTFNTGSPVTALATSPVGAAEIRVAAGGSDGLVKVYKALPAVEWTFAGHIGPATGLSLSGNGKRLAVAAGKIYVYDLTTGTLLMQQMDVGGIHSCAMSPTGETVATVAHPNIVKVYRVFDGAVVYQSSGDTGPMATSVNWSPAGDRVTVTRQDGSFYRVDMGGSGPVPPVSSFSSPVVFRDVDRKPGEVDVTVYTKGGSQLVAHSTASISNDGRIRVEIDGRGEFDVIVKASTFLARKVQMDLTTQNGGQMVFDLLNGDANQDNSVNVADFLMVRRAFGSSQGSPHYLAGADLNKDGRVDLKDFLIVRRAFGRSGD